MVLVIGQCISLVRAIELEREREREREREIERERERGCEKRTFQLRINNDIQIY